LVILLTGTGLLSFFLDLSCLPLSIQGLRRVPRLSGLVEARLCEMVW